jgi:hypothetical protein
MDKYKMIYAQPIVTETRVYTVKVFCNPVLKRPKYFLTVTDQMDDLKFCESLRSFQAIKVRITEIEFELCLEEYCD